MKKLVVSGLLVYVLLLAGCGTSPTGPTGGDDPAYLWSGGASFEKGPVLHRTEVLPGEVPSYQPDVAQGQVPAYQPDVTPGETPGYEPDFTPGDVPSFEPDVAQGEVPSYQPDVAQGQVPSYQPDVAQGQVPSYQPDVAQGQVPSYQPDVAQGQVPSYQPDFTPGEVPSFQPDVIQGQVPSYQPDVIQGQVPSYQPDVMQGRLPSPWDPKDSGLIPNAFSFKVKIYDQVSQDPFPISSAKFFFDVNWGIMDIHDLGDLLEEEHIYKIYIYYKSASVLSYAGDFTIDSVDERVVSFSWTPVSGETFPDEILVYDYYADGRLADEEALLRGLIPIEDIDTVDGDKEM